MGLNILDPEHAEAFLDSVVEKWKCQRMCSPPTTANMTITLAGDMTAARFRDLWLLRSARDPILKHFMSLMVHADVLHTSTLHKHYKGLGSKYYDLVTEQIEITAKRQGRNQRSLFG